MQLPRAVDGEEVSLAHRALLEGLDVRRCLILQLGLACPTKFCQEQGRNIASCSSYAGGHRCSEALGVEVGKDTVPLTVPYNWECVRDCPWKGPNARLLVRHADYLSKFRVCVHSLSLAKRWAAGEGRSRPAATKPPPPAMPEDQECEAEGMWQGRACSAKIRRGVTDASGKRIQKSIRPVTRREVPGIDGARWLCKACWRATQRLDGPALQAMFGAVVRFCPLAGALRHQHSSDPLQRARRARKMRPVMRAMRVPGSAHRRRAAPRRRRHARLPPRRWRRSLHEHRRPHALPGLWHMRWRFRQQPNWQQRQPRWSARGTRRRERRRLR